MNVQKEVAIWFIAAQRRYKLEVYGKLKNHVNRENPTKKEFMDFCDKEIEKINKCADDEFKKAYELK